VARGGPRRGIGGGPVHHAGLNKRERLADPSVPSFATPNSWFAFAPRCSQRAERRRHTRRSRPTLKTTNRAAVLLIETDSISLIGPTRAVLNALERLADGYGTECDRVQRDFGIAQSQLRDYQARLGKPFPHEAYLSELNALRDQLKAGLSGANQEPGKQEGPSVSEVSEQIKPLKAANTIEATPQRERQKHSSAEEPITAAIRRRTGASSASDLVTESDVAPEAEYVHTQNSSLDPPRTFQERILFERQRKDREPIV